MITPPTEREDGWVRQADAVIIHNTRVIQRICGAATEREYFE